MNGNCFGLRRVAVLCLGCRDLSRCGNRRYATRGDSVRPTTVG